MADLARCPACDTEFSEEARICPMCGYQMRKKKDPDGHTDGDTDGGNSPPQDDPVDTPRD